VSDYPGKDVAMKDYYSLKEAMQLLDLRSVNAFRQLERKYPEAFVNMNTNTIRLRNPWYDKTKLDNFAKTYKLSKQVQIWKHN
jgi:hypothetical protein